MVRMAPDLKSNGLFIVLKPSEFIQSKVDQYADRRIDQLRIATRLTGFYLVNLLLYAGPITLAGFGSPLVDIAPPPIFEALVGPVSADPTTAWEFTLSLIQNSLYILAISILTLGTFHVGVWLTRSSQGILQSVHTVVFSTGVYLAAMFTLTWYLATAAAIAVADDFLIAIQKHFVYFFIDLLEADLGLPGGRPGQIAMVDFTLQGKLALAGLFLTLCYYVYSLYLGARINHGTTRADALIATGFVLLSPAVYVLSSLAMFLMANQSGLQIVT